MLLFNGNLVIFKQTLHVLHEKQEWSYTSQSYYYGFNIGRWNVLHQKQKWSYTSQSYYYGFKIGRRSNSEEITHSTGNFNLLIVLSTCVPNFNENK